MKLTKVVGILKKVVVEIEMLTKLFSDEMMTNIIKVFLYCVENFL